MPHKSELLKIKTITAESSQDKYNASCLYKLAAQGPPLEPQQRYSFFGRASDTFYSSEEKTLHFLKYCRIFAAIFREHN